MRKTTVAIRRRPACGRSLSGTLGLVLLAASAGPAGAAAPAAWAGPPVPETVLAEQRGGFINAEGLKVSVGLESLVRINDERRSQLSVQLPDLSQVAKGTAELSSQLQVIQNGPGSTLSADAGDQLSGLGTVIQNTLDNQLIQNLKALNIEIGGLQSQRHSQIKSRINTQIVESLR